MAKVWNKRDKDVPADAVYVGRPTKWGNPYTVTRYGRDEAVRLYRANFTVGQAQEAREELAGRDLVCWCAPEACHADFLLEIANAD